MFTTRFEVGDTLVIDGGLTIHISATGRDGIVAQIDVNHEATGGRDYHIHRVSRDGGVRVLRSGIADMARVEKLAASL